MWYPVIKKESTMSYLIVLTLILALLTPAAAVQDDDCTEYLEMRQADVDHINEMIENLTTPELGNFYIELSTLRQKYEDMADLHVIAFAGINEDVGFNHRHVTEKAVYILRRDQSNLSRFDQIIQGGHAFAFADFLRPTHACVHVDHEHILAYPALTQ